MGLGYSHGKKDLPTGTCSKEGKLACEVLAEQMRYTYEQEKR